MIGAIEQHWRQYACEAALLGLFMMSACFSVALVECERSPIRRAIASPLGRRAIIGALMGLTGVALIYSPWGKLSGAHMNPATTLSFFLLGKVEGVDTLCYVLAQFIGGVLGVMLAAAILPRFILHPPVACVATQPRSSGWRDQALAFAAEVGMALVLFLSVLVFSNSAVLAPFTGVAAGVLLMLFITFEAPISGMSLNPARTLGSALVGRRYSGLWLYFVAPPLGMLAAALVYLGAAGGESVYCAKLDHSGDAPCIFHCEIERLRRGVKPASDAGIEQLGNRSPETAR